MNPSSAHTVADVMAAGAAESTEETEDVTTEGRQTLYEALLPADVLHKYCFDIEGHGLELVQTMSCAENAVLVGAARMSEKKKIPSFLQSRQLRQKVALLHAINGLFCVR